MLFNSLEFLFGFLPITLGIYYGIVHFRKIKAAAAWLIISSLAFYAWWNIKYLPLLLGSIGFNYFIGKMIETHTEQKKNFLLLGIICNFTVLGYYKYMGFFLKTMNDIFGGNIDISYIILPLGISFFTFTQTAYLIDAYRGETKGYSFLTYALFVTIFPHLIAGPILNHHKMITQFADEKNYDLDFQKMSQGIVIFTFGLFKKVVIADNLIPFVNIAFSNVKELSFIEAWLGALAYTFQLYFDFSGYSEMAMGLAYMLHFEFPLNFNSPYRALSMSDFWRRWHITLSVFLRDYLYIPLGGNRCGKIKKLANLMITMLLGGLWHGAGWTFIFWGGIHGFALVVNHLWREYGFKLPQVVSWLITFITVIIAWVFFRAESLNDAIILIRTMFGMEKVLVDGLIYWGGRKEILWIVACFLISLQPGNVLNIIPWKKTQIKWAVLTAVVLYYCILNFSKTSEFLYFQF